LFGGLDALGTKHPMSNHSYRTTLVIFNQNWGSGLNNLLFMLLLTTVMINRLSVKNNPSSMWVAMKPYADMFYAFIEGFSSVAC
jgi:hypothetical protein